MMNISVGETLRRTRGVVKEGVEPRTKYSMYGYGCEGTAIKSNSFNTDKTRRDKRNNKSLCSKEKRKKKKKTVGRTG